MRIAAERRKAEDRTEGKATALDQWSRVSTGNNGIEALFLQVVGFGAGEGQEKTAMS